MNELEFQNILKGKGIEVSERQLKQFQKYYEILVEWNEKMNLYPIAQSEIYKNGNLTQNDGWE